MDPKQREAYEAWLKRSGSFKCCNEGCDGRTDDWPGWCLDCAPGDPTKVSDGVYDYDVDYTTDPPTYTKLGLRKVSG